jgi:protein required for attachment to host cells
MTTVWILVCDAAKARTFEVRPGNAEWQAVKVALHDDSRKKATELVSDHSGSRSSEGGTVHHNALAPSSSPKDVEKERFARSLADMLDHELRAARFDKWVLVAPPHFVGLMKQSISEAVGKHLLAIVEKDLNHLDVHALADRLRDAIRVPREERPTLREANKRTR